MDFFAGYLAGAAGILIGNPLDVLKVKIQASSPLHSAPVACEPARHTFLKGVAAPVLTYGALNALLYASYNRALPLFDPASGDHAQGSPKHTYYAHFMSGIVAGLATFVISAPTELIKCRAQIAASPDRASLTGKPPSSWDITTQIYAQRGVAGFYHGGVVTALRDAIGYGFYFWTYEASKDWWDAHWTRQLEESTRLGVGGNERLKVLLCGGLAGVATWASIFPLDVIKSRVQTHAAFLDKPAAQGLPEQRPLVARHAALSPRGSLPGAWHVARAAVREEGVAVLFRGLGVCSLRAFIVNAGQWSIYELVMEWLQGR